MEHPISIEADKIRAASVEECLAAFTEFVGGPESWASSLMKALIVADSDIDWRIEVGQWILRARAQGVADLIQGRLTGARKVSTGDAINDQAHSTFLAEMATPMLVHYLTATQWREVVTWEGKQREGEDIDTEIKSPIGSVTAFQVKATDKPGRWLGWKVLPNGELDTQLSFEDGSGSSMIGKVVGGEVDEWVRAAMNKAARQLPRPARQPSIIALCSQRRWALGSTPRVVEREALGQPFFDRERMAQPFLDPAALAEEQATAVREKREPTLYPGLFAGPWRHVGAILMLDYRRGNRFDYLCTVLLNPWAEEAARCEEAWFPHARVLKLDGDDVFRWGPKGFQPGDSKFANDVVLIRP